MLAMASACAKPVDTWALSGRAEVFLISINSRVVVAMTVYAYERADLK